MDEDVRQFECRLSDQGRTYHHERREVMRQCRRDSDTGRRIGGRRIGDSTGFFHVRRRQSSPPEARKGSKPSRNPWQYLSLKPFDDRLGEDAMLNAAIRTAFGARRGGPTRDCSDQG
jgi:hypothetical protein